MNSDDKESRPPKPEKWFDWDEILEPSLASEWDFGSRGLIEKTAWLISRQAVMLKQISAKGMSGRQSLGFPLIVGISSNAIAILRLARQNFGSEIYPLLRTLIERLITFYYIQYCDEEEAKNYVDYSQQKTIRAFDREMGVLEKYHPNKYSGSIDLTEHPELQKALAKFTSRNSKREITRWSPTSLTEKLEIISKSGFVDIRLLTIMLETVYDDASEVLHGTLYGCLFFLGAFNVGASPNNREEMYKHYRSDLSMIFFLLCFLLIEFNEYLAKEIKDDELMKEVNAGRAQCLDIFEKSGRPS